MGSQSRDYLVPSMPPAVATHAHFGFSAGSIVLLGLKTSSILSSGILAGTLTAHSFHTVPMLLECESHITILRQFRLLHDKTRKEAIIDPIYTSLTLFVGCIGTSRVGFFPTSPLFILSGLLIVCTVPYKLIFMKSTETKLLSLYNTEVVEGDALVRSSSDNVVIVKGEVRELVDRWGVENAGRAFLATAGFMLGITGAFVSHLPARAWGAWAEA